MAAGAKARLATLPPLWTPDHAKPIRDARNAGVGGFPAIIRSERAETLHIERSGGEVPVRIIAGEAPKGNYLYLHGARTSVVCVKRVYVRVDPGGSRSLTQKK